MRKELFVVLGMAIFFPSAVYAHQIVGDGGFMSGLKHPVLGFDHLLAMLSVGILSAQMGGKAIWTVPSTFVFVMLIGGIIGLKGIGLISVELGIAFSVLALGLAIAIEKKLSPLLAMAFVGFFALFHGYAHGSEMPYLADPIFYACGFILGTAAIHIMGVLVGVIIEHFKHGKQSLRHTGAAIAAIGFYLIIM